MILIRLRDLQDFRLGTSISQVPIIGYCKPGYDGVPIIICVVDKEMPAGFIIWIEGQPQQSLFRGIEPYPAPDIKEGVGKQVPIFIDQDPAPLLNDK